MFGMKYAVLADIHSNLEAFRSVLAHLKGADKNVFLGDIVGYGPNPNECIELLRSKEFICVAGNHDRAAIGQLDTERFNREAKEAIDWTSMALNPASRKFLEGLPDHLEVDDLEMVHGSLRDPLEEYIANIEDSKATIELMKKRLCFVGHLHIPLCIVKDREGRFDGWQLNDGDVVDVSKFDKVVMGVGGVGQPRDMDPRASFAIYDSGSGEVQLFRVSYNIEETQKKMKKAELPGFLIERLKYGR